MNEMIVTGGKEEEPVEFDVQVSFLSDGVNGPTALWNKHSWNRRTLERNTRNSVQDTLSLRCLGWIRDRFSEGYWTHTSEALAWKSTAREVNLAVIRICMVTESTEYESTREYGIGRILGGTRQEVKEWKDPMTDRKQSKWSRENKGKRWHGSLENRAFWEGRGWSTMSTITKRPSKVKTKIYQLELDWNTSLAGGRFVEVMKLEASLSQLITQSSGSPRRTRMQPLPPSWWPFQESISSLKE